jgi:hypothetical protein
LRGRVFAGNFIAISPDLTNMGARFMNNEPDENPPKPNYKWPWFVLAAVVLGIVLAILWMLAAVQREKSERDFSTPVPAAR